MIALDVNVLVYAHRSDLEHHALIRPWLERTLGSDAPYALSDLVLSGFLRVVTHPRVFAQPSPTSTALAFAATLRERSNRVELLPGRRHWSIFEQLCRTSKLRGNLIADAYFAALAIESGSEWASTDGDFARFPDLRWINPLTQ